MTPEQIEQVLADHLMPPATVTVEALVAEVESLIRQGQGEAERRTRDRICAAGYRETPASITARVGRSLGPPEHRAAEVIIAAGWLPPAEVARRVDEHLAEVERRIEVRMAAADKVRSVHERIGAALDICRDYREEVRHG